MLFRSIAEAIITSVNNIDASRCILLGYGRCAKALARTLRGLGADVWIVARRDEVLEEARQEGFSTLHFNELSHMAKSAQFIFNTIPSLVLTSDTIEVLPKDAIIIDIASAPGGTDFDACKKAQIKANLSLGIPGRYSPKTSAEILYRAILTLLRD